MFLLCKRDSVENRGGSAAAGCRQGHRQGHQQCRRHPRGGSAVAVQRRVGVVQRQITMVQE